VNASHASGCPGVAELALGTAWAQPLALMAEYGARAVAVDNRGEVLMSAVMHS
jgi:hypothetical protein